MINLTEIIDYIKPIEVIGQNTSQVAAVIQLSTSNTYNDVLMWVSQKNNYKLSTVNAGIILCTNIDEDLIKPECTYILCANPRSAFQKVLSKFFLPKRLIGIAPTAFIDETVQLGKNIYIGHHVVIEEGCIIGDNTSIDHNTVLKAQTKIGSDVTIGSNNVIGGVGFGYEKDETGEYVFIPHLGNVVIKSKVDIGNNTCIDRAVLGSTIIENNVKIDNLVHIAHGVKIGKNSLVIANAMVAGSVEIGENVWVAPSSSILNGLTIADNSMIGLGAVVVKKVAENTIIIGNPGKPLIKKDL